MRMLVIVLAFFGAFSSPLRAQSPEAKLLRYPHVQGQKIAFCHGGDIWTVSLDGGRARRVTSFDEGLELFPRISPDGNWIAFSGEYGGSRQVFLIPYEGGEPKQLTFYPDVGVMPPRGGYDNLVYDWTPDGKKILVRSNRTPFGQRAGKYFLVDAKGQGMETALPVPEGGAASFSPDGSKLAYNVISREWRTWKRYRAGRAQDVYIYDLKSNVAHRITDFEGTDNSPMWLGEKIYFTSDRTGVLNLFAYELRTKSVKQVSEFEDFDVLFPARGAGGIAFEKGGELWFMDAKTEECRKIRVTLSDDQPWRRAVWKKGAGKNGGFDLSPSGKRIVFEFRGEIFDAPAENGEPTNLTRTASRRERQPRWSPDGRWISYLAEVGDDYELFLFDRRSKREKQLTKDTGAWILSTVWSPDSAHILLTDKAQRVRAVAVGDGKIIQLDRALESVPSQVSWAADSKWVCYLKAGANRYSSVWVCSIANPAPRRVTSERWSDGSPSFDPKGRWLWFSSARSFNYRELSFDQRLYGLLLNPDVPSPIPYREDLESEGLGDSAKAAKNDSDGDGEDKKEKDAKSRDFKIDFAGIEDRLIVLPGSAGSYRGLTAMKGGLLFSSGGKLQLYDFDERETKTVLDGVRGYRSGAKRDRLIYRHRGKICLAKPKPKQEAGANAVDLDSLSLKVDPRVEWSQMYQDAWRIMRDWFYDPKMHRVDWLAMRKKYEPLLAHMSHRSDLDFLLGELVGELNAGHTYVSSGENPTVDRVAAGALGCVLEPSDGRYRIAKIYKGENWDRAGRSPLTEPGVDARVGDYLLAIDGHQILAADHPYKHLVGTVGRRVRLSLCESTDIEKAREVVVRPIASEVRLRYLEWVEKNRKIVDRLSGGRIGYVHVPNTSVEGHRRLYEGFRPLVRVKDGIIIDDRYNGGGFIPDRMANFLAQRVLNYWSRRDAELYPTPRFGFNGPMAMLINGYSSSGGDAFPYYFRRLGLGPLIGKTTWGGLVGYSGSPRLLDGGGLSVPSFAFVNDAGDWDVEAVGVRPDIEVEDQPGLIQQGREPMIERAVIYLLEELEKASKIKRPDVPDGPKRDR